jgi:inosine-uridine nucleoside N-ribohydrolase
LVLDTDLGTDIDDTWALAMVLKSPELDLRLVVAADGDTTYRARLAAKLLDSWGRSDVAVGVGPPGAPTPSPQQAAIRDFELDDYPGEIHRDGVDALIQTLMEAERPVALVAIGPLTNVAEALRREPRIAERARLIGMHGSVRLGYRASSEIAAEYNVVRDISACQQAFAAPWSVTITPLDSCGALYLRGDDYARLRQSEDPLARSLLEHYGAWLDAVRGSRELLERRSTTLYDCAAVQLAIDEEPFVIEDLGISVDDQGFTRIDESGKQLRVATGWTDLAAFHESLVDRLLG